MRTVLTMRVREGGEAAFEAAWGAAAQEIRRVPGQLGQELMRDERDPRTFAIVSDWVDRASVDAFGRSAAREVLTEALRDLREDASRSTYSVLARVEAAPLEEEEVPAVRVDISTAVRPGEEEAFERAYLTVAGRVGGAAGHVREELLREADGSRYHIFAEWESEAEFLEWVEDPAHMEDSGPLARWLSVDFARLVTQIRQRPGDDPASPPAPGAVRVDVTTAVPPAESEAFEQAYLEVAGRAVGAPGLVRQELLREEDGLGYHVLAEWDSEQQFLDWAGVSENLGSAGPLARWLTADSERTVLSLRQRPDLTSLKAGRRGGTQDGTQDPTGSTGPGPGAAELAAEGVVSAAEPGLEAVAGQPVATDDVDALSVDSSAEEAQETAETAQPEPVAPPAVGAAPAAPASAGDPEVLVVGAGPAGMTHAIELARRGVRVRVLDKRAEPSTQADKAIGIHCRTMEIWERQGIVEEAMDAGTWLHGQTVFVNGEQTHQVDWSGLQELPFAHLGLPQYDTERLLGDKLASLGVAVERGAELLGFTQDEDAVTSTVRSSTGEESVVRSQYLVGCDGAHSAVRSGLGLTFEGGLSMFPQLFMLGDVDLDWDMPAGHLLRFVRIEDDGDFTGMLVCVPLKGARRYRVATIAPAHLRKTIGAGVVEAGFWKEYDPPALSDIQDVVTELAPPGTTASNLRWSSVFRIKHGIVDRYRDGRVFVAGDAAHLHPPAGGQGMNTGIQDAWNLGWKLALAVRGRASEGLLDSYEAERRPAGKAVVDRAVNLAFTDEMDMEDEKAQFLLEMQMTMNYAGSPLVGQAVEHPEAGPEPGHRAPDATGLRRFGVSHDVRLFEVLRRTGPALLLYVDASAPASVVADLGKVAGVSQAASHDELAVHVVASPDASVPASVELPVYVDARGEFRDAYGVSGAAAYVVRPDGHVGYRTASVDATDLSEHLAGVYA